MADHSGSADGNGDECNSFHDLVLGIPSKVYQRPVSCALVVFPVLGKANKMLIQCLPPSNEEVLSGPTGSGGATVTFPFGSIYIFTYLKSGWMIGCGGQMSCQMGEWVPGKIVQMC
ncbi:hypothetical protein QTP88_026093 [Uroleucon formosanum]